MPGSSTIDARITVERNTHDHFEPDFAGDVLRGLSARQKYLYAMYLYDKKGSELFEQICELPEYYLTRTEAEILETYAAEIVACSEGNMELVELGSGSSTKTRVLIEALVKKQGLLHYFPIDISESILVSSSRALLQAYPELEITAHVAEYQAGISKIAETDFEQKLVLFLGSNLGNFDAADARRFLLQLRQSLSQQDCLLLCVDLKKEREVLEAAYNDAQGITAAFNLNVLTRMNRELGADFDVSAFEHRAPYNEDKGRIEMHLVSCKPQSVYIASLDQSFSFEEGETIHVENSYKFSLRQIDELSAKCGFRVRDRWMDANNWFSVNLLQPV